MPFSVEMSGFFDDLACVVWKTNPFYWQAYAGLSAAKAAGRDQDQGRVPGAREAGRRRRLPVRHPRRHLGHLRALRLRGRLQRRGAPPPPPAAGEAAALQRHLAAQQRRPGGDLRLGRGAPRRRDAGGARQRLPPHHDRRVRHRRRPDPVRRGLEQEQRRPGGRVGLGPRALRAEGRRPPQQGLPPARPRYRRHRRRAVPAQRGLEQERRRPAGRVRLGPRALPREGPADARPGLPAGAARPVRPRRWAVPVQRRLEQGSARPAGGLRLGPRALRLEARRPAAGGLSPGGCRHLRHRRRVPHGRRLEQSGATQDAIWGWAPEHFLAKDQQMRDAGYRIIALDGFDI